MVTGLGSSLTPFFSYFPLLTPASPASRSLCTQPPPGPQCLEPGPCLWARPHPPSGPGIPRQLHQTTPRLTHNTHADAHFCQRKHTSPHDGPQVVAAVTSLSWPPATCQHPASLLPLETANTLPPQGLCTGGARCPGRCFLRQACGPCLHVF